MGEPEIHLKRVKNVLFRILNRYSILIYLSKSEYKS